MLNILTYFLSYLWKHILEHLNKSSYTYASMMTFNTDKLVHLMSC